MNTRFSLPLIAAVVALLCVGRSLHAQTSAPSGSGVLANPNGGDPMLAQAIFVKLRASALGDRGSAAVLVRSLANDLGLTVTSSAPLPFTQVPDTKDQHDRLLAMAPADRARADAAQANLERLIELHYDRAMSPLEAARMMARLPQVEYAEPIYLPHVLGPNDPSVASLVPPNDPLLDSQYQVDLVKLKQAWEVWKGDSNTVIGVVDAGIDMFHEDLAPNIKENPKETGLDDKGNDKRTNRKDDDGNGVVDDWRGANLTTDIDGSTPGDTKGQTHGTSVSGFCSAAANNAIGIAGSGYRCRFFPIKTAPRDGGLLVRAYNGIAYAAQSLHRVINCSFGGGTYSQAIQDVITGLVERYDCCIVAAGGNDVAYTEFYPAGYTHVLCVGALDRDNAFSTTWGEHIDVSSPGGFTTTDNNGYADGGAATSYATPVVSGIVALVRSKWPLLKADQVAAHIRLTADSLAPIAGKRRLTGFGRVNAFRAVSVDPLSHPAIEVDSVWLADESLTAIDRTTVGRFARLRLRLHNLLGKATNIRVRIVTYTDDSATVWIRDSTLTLASLNTGQTDVVPGGIQFQLKQANGDRVHLRVELSADGGYSDYHYTRVLFYAPYVTYRTPSITMSISDRGRLGFADYPANTIGEGFQYAHTPFLYEGGFILASDEVRVLNNIRTGNPDVQKSDFNTTEFPNSSNGYTLTLNDAGAGERRIGLEMRINVITLDTVPDGIAIRLRTRNVSTTTIDSLRIAMFADWDLDATTPGQSLDYREAPKTNVPFYGIAESASGYFLAHGVARPATLPIFYAIRNDSLPFNLYDGFGDDEKWYAVSNGVGSRRVKMADSSDISLIIGKRVTRMAPQSEDTTTFVIGISIVGSEAVDNMRRMVPPFVDTTTSVVITGDAGSSALLRGVSPNPISSSARIDVGPLDAGATLRVFDAVGRMVADLSARLPHDGRSAGVRFDASALPNGIYQIQLSTARGVETRRVILVR